MVKLNTIGMAAVWIKTSWSTSESSNDKQLLLSVGFHVQVDPGQVGGEVAFS
jgi:hypothetical protein